MLIHVVQPGDTLFSIAGRYGVDPGLLRRDNGVPTSGALAVGQSLIVQFPSTYHVVQSGENLSAIAARYGISLRQLYRNNYTLFGNPTIFPGQLLVITYRDEKLGSIVTNSYAYPNIEPKLLSSTLPYLSFFTPFTYGLDEEGNLLPLDDAFLLMEARRLGAIPILHLSTLMEDGGFSSQRAVDVLTSPERQARLTEQLVYTMQEKGYGGLDVDFEYVPAAQKEEYTQFIYNLRQRLAPMGVPVMVALAPKTYDAQPGLLYEAHSYGMLGAAADYVLLMTYEWGYTFGPPMAVAPIPNVRKVLEYALSEIPAKKIFLGIPNYGYDWALPYEQGVSRAQSLSTQEAVAIAVAHGAEIQYDSVAQSPWFTYTHGGVVHQVWFEDARSLQAKLSLVQEYGLLGAGFWNSMRSNPQGWVLLNALYQVEDLAEAE